MFAGGRRLIRRHDAADGVDVDDARGRTRGAKGSDAEGYRKQMIEMVKRAARLPKS